MIRFTLLAAAAALLMGSDAAPVPIAPATFVDWTADHGGDRVSADGVSVMNATLPCPAVNGAVPDGCWRFGARLEVPGKTPVTLVGTQGSVGKLAIGPLGRGQRPAVILDTFTGGAHCCEQYRIAMPEGAGYRLVTLSRPILGTPGATSTEQFDNGLDGFPRDVSGDGVADFIVGDDAFNYTFSSYAGSIDPPVILNYVGGRFVDVSTGKAFAPLFARQMATARAACVAPGDNDRNGACAAYAADAARLGRFAEAWPVVLAHAERGGGDADWSLKRCTVAYVDSHCPAGKEITYRDFPAALRDFLVIHGYLGK